MISSYRNEITISVVSVWEIAIKRALSRDHRKSIPMTASHAVRLFAEAGYSLLGVSPEHAVAVEALPLLHGDPFDRMLVAQALTEPLRLITHDARVAAYSNTFVHF